MGVGILVHAQGGNGGGKKAAKAKSVAAYRGGRGGVNAMV